MRRENITRHRNTTAHPRKQDKQRRQTVKKTTDRKPAVDRLKYGTASFLFKKLIKFLLSIKVSFVLKTHQKQSRILEKKKKKFINFLYWDF